MIAKLILLAFLAAAVYAARRSRNGSIGKFNCNNQTRLDECANKLTLFGDEKFVFPENIREMNKHCRNIVRYEKCIKQYAHNCLPTYAKQVTSVLIYGVAKTNKGYCTGTKKKRSFIELGKCGNQILQEGRSCLHQYIDDLQGIASKAVKKLKIPMSCCKYYDLKQCILQKIQKVGSPLCREKQEVEYERVVDGYAEEVLRLICTDYTEDSDKCVGLSPRVPRKDKSIKRTASILPPFIDILIALD